MSERTTSILLDDMLFCIQKIVDYTQGMNESGFIADAKTFDAVLHNVQIIGEAASKIPKPFRLMHPEIEWQKIIGSRHIIVHEYSLVNHAVVWRIVSTHLPPLLPLLQNILDELDANEALS